MRIGIDAGHRSTTPGKRTPPMPYDVDVYGDGSYIIRAGEQLHEHVAAVGVAVKLDAALRRCGLETYKVAWDDADGTNDETLDDLTERQLYVLEGECDLLISIHWNAYGAEFNTANGVETWYHSTPARAGDSARLAELIQAYIVQATGQRDRGVKRDSWAMCDCVMLGTKAAALVELGFMTNEKEAITMMANTAYWQTAAEAICRAACEYCGVDYVAPTLMSAAEEEEEEMVRYAYLNDIPNEYGFRDIINKLMDAKILNGDGTDPDGNDDLIDLSHDQVRSFVFDYRGGAFDRKLIAMGMSPAVPE